MNDETSDSSDRRSRILAGAREAFLRFGFERTSLADIASGAGVSRTAIYHYFTNKDEVLRAVVDEMNARTLQASRRVLDEQLPMETALVGLLDAKFGRTLALLKESPHGAELIDATHRLVAPAARAADAAFQACVVEALIAGGMEADANGSADTIVAAAKGLLGSADGLVSRERYLERISRLARWAAS
jgi:AcrR family transcriptional regulator